MAKYWKKYLAIWSRCIWTSMKNNLSHLRTDQIRIFFWDLVKVFTILVILMQVVAGSRVQRQLTKVVPNSHLDWNRRLWNDQESWLWLSWQSGRFRHQRSAVRIHSSDIVKEHWFTVNCIEKTKKKAKSGPFFKRPNNYLCNNFYSSKQDQYRLPGMRWIER